MHFLLCKIIIILTLIMPITAYADVPTLEGEDLFNQTVERSMTGDLSLNPTDILNMLSDDIMGEIRECTDDVIILFIIAAISGIITTISTSFGNKSTSEAAFFACFTLMSAAAIKCFGTAMEYGTTVVTAMTDFITKFSPLLMIMIATSGKAVSASTFQPVMSAAVYVVSIIIEKCLVPLIAFSSVLAVAGNISVICVLPILKIGVIQLMLKLTSSIAEPLTDKRVSSMLWEVSESVTTIFAVVVMVAVLFMINISIMITSTGI